MLFLCTIGTGLGFRITGGVDGFGIFIWSVTTGSIADTTKLVKVGDQILKVHVMCMCF